MIVLVCKRSCIHSMLQYPPDCFTIRAPEELAHACLTKTNIFGINMYYFRYDFPVALISALALFKNVIFRLARVEKNFFC